MLTDFISDLIVLVRNHETMPPCALTAKAAEELGELSEHAMVAEGYSHKKFMEEVEGEVADLVNCAMSIGIKIRIDQGWNDSDIQSEIEQNLLRKLAKYKHNVQFWQP